MSNITVSVIVPVYNCIEFLPACLDSLLNQTCPPSEIILVDDGSTDGCGAVCDSYAAEHRLIRVLHQENKGISAARNIGVKTASGEYVMFADADDCVSADCLAYLLELLTESGTRLAMAEPLTRFASELGSDPEQTLRRVSASELVPALCRSGYGAYSKLYFRELLLAHPYPEGKLYEDLSTTCKIIGDCDYIALGSRRIYCYRDNPGSIVRQRFSPAHLDMIDAAEAQYGYVKQRFPEAENAALIKLIENISETAIMMFAEAKPDRNSFDTVRETLKKYDGLYRRCPGRDFNHLRYCDAIRAGRLPSLLLFRIVNRLRRLKHK